MCGCIAIEKGHFFFLPTFRLIGGFRLVLAVLEES